MSGSRVVRVAWAGWGAGYEIAPGLVLTAAHVVGAVGSPVGVARIGTSVDHPGLVVWRGMPEGGGGAQHASHTDVALVRVTSESWEPAGPAQVSWGRIAGDSASVAWRATGFPHTEYRSRESEQAEGRISPLNGLVGGVYVLDGTTYRPRGTRDSAWNGMSGAAVLCGDFVVGVVVADIPDRVPARLEAEPAIVLLHDVSFLAALDTHGAPGPHVPQPVEYADLADPDHHTVPRHPPRSAVELLHPARAVVPFHGRAAELGALTAWTEQTDSEVAVVHAPGGRGKTRLAVELARSLQPRWSVVWLRPGARPAHDTCAPGLPLLMVVDGADGRVEEARAVLDFTARHREAPVKAVLLARSAGDWIEEVAGDSLQRGAMLSTALVRELPELPLGGPDGYRDTARALAHGLESLSGHDGPAWHGYAARTPPPLPEGTHGSPLTLHMAALVHLLDAARGVAASPGDASAVEKRLLQHERAHWRGTARASRLCPPLLWRMLEDAVVAVVALGPRGPRETTAVLARVLGTDQGGAAPGDLRAVHAWVRATLLADGDAAVRLRPDRLAERLVGERVRDDPGLVDALLPAATPDQATSFLALVTRACVRGAGPDGGTLTDWCLRHPAVLGPAAVALASRLEEPAPLLAALEALVDRPDAGLDELEHLASAVPPHPYLLAPWVLTLHRRIVAAHRLRAATDPAARPGLAVALREISKRLSSVGEREECLEAVREAYDLWREIPPDHPRHQAERGACRVNAAIFLSDVERRREAYEAATEGVELLRAALRPDDPESRVDLVKALDTRAAAARLLGDHDTAWRVIEESRRLCEALWDGDPEAHDTLMVNHLNNHAIVAMESGRRDLALASTRRAVRLQRRLAEENPDAALSGLALVLATASSAAQLAGSHREALAHIRESVALRRRLAEARPRAYQADFANSLNSLAIDLGNLGHQAEALDAAEEAVGLYRDLADERPHIHTPRLALALNTLATQRQTSGYRLRAQRVASQSVHLFRELARAEPDGFRNLLAMALTTLAGTLRSEDGTPRETARAAGHFREAADILRELAASAPGAHLPDLAACLNNLAGAHLALGEPQAALATVRESIELNSAAERDLPAAFAEPMLRNWLTAMRVHYDLGDLENALEAAEEALRRLRTLSVEAPLRYETDLWSVLATTGELLWIGGQHEESLRRSREALDIKGGWVRRGDSQERQEHRSEQADDLERHARRLWWLGRPTEAATVADEARAHRRAAHRHRGDEASGLALARSEALLAETLESRGDWQGALPPVNSALAGLRAHHSGDPSDLRAELTNVLLRRARVLWRTGDPSAAVASVDEALAVARTDAEPPLADTVVGDALLQRAVLRFEMAAASDAAPPAAALPPLAEAVEFCAALPDDTWGTALRAGSLHAFALCAATVPGSGEEAATASEDAVRILRRLNEDGPPPLGPVLTELLAGQARVLALTGRARQATEVAREAVGRAREHAAGEPHAHRELLAHALAGLARARLAAGDRSAAARATSAEALTLFQGLLAEQPLAMARYAGEAREIHDLLHADRAGAPEQPAPSP
ncbi:tetratricopeptide repeat protein [Streptomyces sp. 71268]|uniref:tetratricopeptide repeat protein n=1 Tax=Streptomyces sp. 71268 TaxID=3002640 RepID=UPI0023F65798|nr:tetratricopeptide repeat protein [Streptomyces sp. 71268]WEV28610.1 tetratricopeptide repeat protein [Streptomyces sp. 71268]